MNHPNIVKYLGIFSLDNIETYLVVELVADGNLQQFVQDKVKELDFESLLLMYLIEIHVLIMNEFRSKQIAGALRYLEELLVIHNDLALRNLLVNRIGSTGFQVKIADFGLRYIH